MKLHTLQPAEGSTKNRKRIGRGTGSGRGGTSTRGHKGAKSRSGYKTKLGFEGGQMPLQRRVPKFGFKSLNRVEFKPVNLDTLQSLATTYNLESIDMDTMVSHGIASKNDKIKILGGGELSSKVSVTAHSFSASAVAAIEKAGGSVNKI
ncbi:MAG TPA: 50S ribosomal protein L15 [Algoriphagus sp.]|jgi:large subunit ribosomal protein L15|uniref:Large ribosomal subunit protein uL15 n=1 Tax=Algoriphagus ornithinivorans TaxID=226506 RepID=A0A1I5FC82_9BACT|nr:MULTISPECIES: 50S ribosomal protein L15 [Algoriphagus]MAL15005.1 50S ribosomal protein L15 [Algoriphagus sp.]QYH39863.1 50S ribosomal protein L15 [Algoriphagus sp. NBT04N3]SFO21226.1 LSU ribosomal protein L15P [Algoriphagus ornithinivorans]HAD52456.1 50S ribosomal protein L15 [Algoriphagus sp.]HAH35051.1 50S ribosomal protein L15 [Algoriphagus sp.]|tara:strand:- start:5603 stop:6049 length:447 start_codon:yes stop_codon:yes gene_type:complete